MVPAGKTEEYRKLERNRAGERRGAGGRELEEEKEKKGVRQNAFDQNSILI